MDSYEKGQVARLFSSDATDMELSVTMPDGIRMIYPSARSVRVQLTQLGTWTYQWSNGEAGQLSVVQPQASLELIDEPAAQVAPASALRSSPL